MSIQSQNPYTEKIEKTFNACTPAEAIKACVRADKAFALWKDVPVKKRAQLVKNIAKNLRANKEAYARVITREMGKPITQSIAEIEKCAWNCEYIAKHGPEFLKDELVETEMQKSAVRFASLGVILAVMPWNFPFWQVFRFASLALLAGNTAILKHASNVPQSAKLIEKIIRESGFPKDAFQTLFIQSRDIETVIAHDGVRMVILTGSEKAGSEVGALSGKHIKKSVLELGGADAFIVMSDADLDEAVKIGVQSRMGNNGQACNAAKRFLVHEKVAKEVTARFKEKLEAFVVGDPLDPATTLGPLARGDIQEELHVQVRDSILKGAKCLIGGEKIDKQGFFYAPTILTNVRPGMPAFDEELFGPVVSIITFKDEVEAIRLANMHRYGLSATIFSKNVKKAEKMADQLDVGVVAINGIAKSDPRMPFGGTKKSGYGREMGKFGIREFTNIQTRMVK
jgi:succinate-semialdehyde dehydrogenase/glutarate-semialdehyde dehydrogenase